MHRKAGRVEFAVICPPLGRKTGSRRAQAVDAAQVGGAA